MNLPHPLYAKIKTMKNKSLIIFLAIVLVLATGIGINYWQKNVASQNLPANQATNEILNNEPNNLPANTSAEAITETLTIALNIEQDETDVWQMLQQQHTVEFEQYDFGIFIKGIDGLMADNKHYFAIYLNDQYAQTGIDQLQVKSGDVVKIVYEELTASPY